MFQQVSDACAHEPVHGRAAQRLLNDGITVAKQTWGAAPPPGREPGPPLVERVGCLLAALPLLVDGHDHVLGEQLAALGLVETGLILRRLRLGDRRRFNLVVVPDRVRQEPEQLRLLTHLRAREGHLGRRLVLVSEAVIDRQPRLANARLILDCAGFLPSTSGRLAVTAHLAGTGAVELITLLPLLRRHIDPAASVLALVAAKTLAVDLDRPLGPHSVVRLSPLAVQAKH